MFKADPLSELVVFYWDQVTNLEILKLQVPFCKRHRFLSKSSSQAVIHSHRCSLAKKPLCSIKNSHSNWLINNVLLLLILLCTHLLFHICTCIKSVYVYNLHILNFCYSTFLPKYPWMLMFSRIGRFPLRNCRFYLHSKWSLMVLIGSINLHKIYLVFLWPFSLFDLF